jgi:predicted O-methyltransferase YrrM
MKINLNNNDLNDIAINYLQEKCRGIAKEYFALHSGKEPYRLLFFLAQQFNNSTIIDLGTSNGASALALSANKTNQIYSFDITDRCETSFLQSKNNFEKTPSFPNVDFIVTQDFTKYIDLFLKSPFIYLDIAHDGTWENILIDLLIKNNYKGIMVLDDIHAFPEMKILWNKLTFNKVDITRYGHWSGTGLVDFSNEIEFELL